MGTSWSGMRKHLEQEALCDSLKGRVAYFATRYRDSHDNEGRIAVLFDGKEVFKSSWFRWGEEYRKAYTDESDHAKTWAKYDDRSHQYALDHGGMDQFCFYNAFYAYQNQSIEKSLADGDPIVRLFAIFDKRVGKRRLQEIKSQVEDQPDWLRPFYRLRLQAEQIAE